MRPQLAEVPQFADQAISELSLRPDLRPALYLVPDPPDQPAAELSSATIIEASNIPELSAERQLAATEAARILAQNRHLLHNGGGESVPTAVDALGTARQAVEIKREFGADSPEYQQVFSGLMLDSERLLGEAFSKNTAEYFAKVHQQHDAETGEYTAHGLSISRMVENGLSPMTNPEEQDRRVNEYVEERTYEAIGKSIARVGLQSLIEQLPERIGTNTGTVGSEKPQSSLHVDTISLCTDRAIEGHKVNPKGSHGGYAPAVEKLMIRRVHFVDNSADRYEEQVAIPGIYITPDLIQEVLAEKGATSPKELTKTELHGTQFIGVGGAGVIELVRDLDQRASEVHGKAIFMGEAVSADHPRDYGEFVDEAEIRRAKLAPKPKQLANYLIRMEENGTDPRLAAGLVDKFLKQTLLEVARKRPELAEAMFDKATAEGFREVAYLAALGKYDEAQHLQLIVEKNAPEVSYCGGGSCGLDGVEDSSPAGQMARRLGLKGKMVRNKESACKNCKAKSLHHDYNGNTACTSCLSTKLSGQTVKNASSHSKKTRESSPVVSLDEKRNSGKKRSNKNRLPFPRKPAEVIQLRPTDVTQLRPSPKPQNRPPAA